MIKALKRLFGLGPCVSCGKDLSFNWSKNLERNHSLSNSRGIQKIHLKASIHVEGVCTDCFEPQAAAAMKKIECAFAELVPETVEAP